MENSKNSNIIQLVLVAALVGATFYIGSLSSKVGKLEDREKIADNAPAAKTNEIPVAKLPNLQLLRTEDYLRGDPDAQVLLFEYSDYDCPFCKRVHPTLVKLLENNPGKVAWVYRQMPITQLHPDARDKSEAALCAGKIGGSDAFWAYTDALAVSEASAGDDFDVVALATSLNINSAAFKSCVDNRETKSQVEKDEASGKAINIQGTPGIVMYDTKSGLSVRIPGAVDIDTMQLFYDNLLTGKSTVL